MDVNKFQTHIGNAMTKTVVRGSGKASRGGCEPGQVRKRNEDPFGASG